MKIISVLLLPLSWLYGLIIWIRNKCYDLNIVRGIRVGVPVISVGNITAGGTGKTPFVEYLLKKLFEKNKKVAVVSRGYKRSTAGTVVVSDGEKMHAGVQDAGDEPYQIAKKYPKAVVIVDVQRVRGAKRVVNNYGAEVIVLDDGFQHRSLYRDLEIVMIDGQKSLKDIHLLPAGLRREPLASLRRAHLLAVTGSRGSLPIVDELNEYTTAQTMVVGYKPKRFQQVFGQQVVSLSQVQGKTCVAFCGIGNPTSFKISLEVLGLDIVKFLRYRDHYQYKKGDLNALYKEFVERKVDCIVTTEKDAVRLQIIKEGSAALLDHLYYLEIEVEILEGEDVLQQHLHTVLQGAA